jgi:hypothetical protein
MQMQDDELLMASGAAKILNRSAEGVRYYERIGKLRAIRTADGTRLFRQSDVEQLAAELRERDQPKQISFKKGLADEILVDHAERNPKGMSDAKQ